MSSTPVNKHVNDTRVIALNVTPAVLFSRLTFFNITQPFKNLKNPRKVFSVSLIFPFNSGESDRLRPKTTSLIKMVSLDCVKKKSYIIECST